MQTPAERLSLSRERLRHALAGTSDTTTEAGATPRAHPAWWHSLRSLPGAGVLIEAAEQWWARHPMRVTTMVALNAAQAVVQPLAKKHPLGLVTAAFVVGGLLGWRRPRNWILKPALLAGLLPQLLIASLKAHAQTQRPPTTARD
ncbi:MAG: hypothetical protein V4792_11925 [Pseudomonadota bacterium]